MSFDLRKHVVNDVVLNNTMENMASNETEFTINSRKRTLDKSQVVGIVVSSILVSVVQISDGDYPKISI